MGLLSGEMVVIAMNAGLVLLLALFGFTVTQFAFSGMDHMGKGPADRFYFNGQAIEGAGLASGIGMHAMIRLKLARKWKKRLVFRGGH